jgi:hypothetical protein
MTNASRSPATHKPVVRMASGARVVNYTLADPEVAVRMNALHTRLTGSKEDAVGFLKKVGIINRSGKLSKNFGG